MHNAPEYVVSIDNVTVNNSGIQVSGVDYGKVPRQPFLFNLLEHNQQQQQHNHQHNQPQPVPLEQYPLDQKYLEQQQQQQKQQKQKQGPPQRPYIYHHLEHNYQQFQKKPQTSQRETHQPPQQQKQYIQNQSPQQRQQQHQQYQQNHNQHQHHHQPLKFPTPQIPEIDTSGQFNNIDVINNSQPQLLYMPVVINDDFNQVTRFVRSNIMSIADLISRLDEIEHAIKIWDLQLLSTLFDNWKFDQFLKAVLSPQNDVHNNDDRHKLIKKIVLEQILGLIHPFKDDLTVKEKELNLMIELSFR
ncbi:hypothetical protein WICMUC_003695 [Wickerhamomyces mucosus]|uniref:Uncharacterized protein n=1 Tax=Wickerhamomyces mucosus TaxID=1378264 RepID=A0A9P8PJW2_9ASCO|nr:hypothetical protein WICMUC_003695 [Wickerhamomyces mucosus]